MNTYFLCDPPMIMLPPTGPSALKILIEVSDYSEAIKANVESTVLEAVRFYFGDDGYQNCIEALKKIPGSALPIDKRNDLKEELPKEHWTARNGWRVWFVNDRDDHYKYFTNP